MDTSTHFDCHLNIYIIFLLMHAMLLLSFLLYKALKYVFFTLIKLIVEVFQEQFVHMQPVFTPFSVSPRLKLVYRSRTYLLWR